LRGKRLQALAQLGIGDFAQAFAQFLGYRTKLRPSGRGAGAGGLPWRKTIRLMAE
jgi:hypothetical protein